MIRINELKSMTVEQQINMVKKIRESCNEENFVVELPSSDLLLSQDEELNAVDIMVAEANLYRDYNDSRLTVQEIFEEAYEEATE